ncbi:DNA alkylation repair protein [Catellatospora chokoriensis]|uniref:3-methyladenine DNA glycosylase AlkD n=1 Tax=Catellatospora chokoriensis TaxID=310353 RepID=A0A8J3NVF8_9ACTN|nr:DNA alkylation repair protein [Catellatospora chokoriensis]GIF93898.1 hypothetical protein Cch02nite_73420 [Catellatospora chokoriensis]
MGGGDGQQLAGMVRQRLRELAQPEIVDGIVESRSPGKQVLGIRIPPLRQAVRQSSKAEGGSGAVAAADVLWHGQSHEEELAACMLLRLSGQRLTSEVVASWAPLLDNWLCVDELGGCVGEALLDPTLTLGELGWLAVSSSQWQRRLYVVGLIKPVRDGLDPRQVPHVAELLADRTAMVRKACVWLLSDTVKRRPSAGPQFRQLLPERAPAALTRLVR